MKSSTWVYSVRCIQTSYKGSFLWSGSQVACSSLKAAELQRWGSMAPWHGRANPSRSSSTFKKLLQQNTRSQLPIVLRKSHQFLLYLPSALMSVFVWGALCSLDKVCDLVLLRCWTSALAHLQNRRSIFHYVSQLLHSFGYTLQYFVLSSKCFQICTIVRLWCLSCGVSVPWLR